MAKGAVRIDFKQNITDRLKLYEKKLNLNKTTGVDFESKMKLALQLLNWTVNGSSKESVVPPIMHGILRGSGTVFVGKKQVGDMKSRYRGGTPAKTHDEKPDTVTIGFNTSYATRMHEKIWTPGGKRPSKQAQRNPGILGNVGNKFIEKHLRADGKSLVKMYAALIKKAMG